MDCTASRGNQPYYLCLYSLHKTKVYIAGSKTACTASYAVTTNKVSLGKLKTTSVSQAVTWPAHLPLENPSHPPPETDSKQGLVAACLESHCLSYFRVKHLEELNIVARLQV